jgi:hypothetical protein
LAPSTRRTFARHEQVRAVFQIYQGTGRAEMLAPVTMRVRILDRKGTALRDQSVPFAESSFTGRRTDGVITLPLAALPSGEYLLELGASTTRHTARRAIRFTIE